MPYIIGYDPGFTTGVALGHYSENMPLKIIDSWNATFEQLSVSFHEYGAGFPLLTAIVEKFKLSSGNRYTADLTGVQVEGLLRHYYSDIVWQDRSDKSVISDQVLKDNGYWVDKKMSNWVDGRDQNDAIIHMLVWLMRNGHLPTISMINPKGE